MRSIKYACEVERRVLWSPHISLPLPHHIIILQSARSRCVTLSCCTLPSHLALTGPLLRPNSDSTAETTDTATSTSPYHLHPQLQYSQKRPIKSTFDVHVGAPTWESCTGLINRFPGYINTATRARGQEFAFVQSEVFRGAWTVRFVHYHWHIQHQIYRLLDMRTYVPSLDATHNGVSCPPFPFVDIRVAGADK